jgi:hypothetical protein
MVRSWTKPVKRARKLGHPARGLGPISLNLNPRRGAPFDLTSNFRR